MTAFFRTAGLVYILISFSNCLSPETCGRGDIVLDISCGQIRAAEFRLYYQAVGEAEVELAPMPAACPEVSVRIRTRANKGPLAFRVDAVGADSTLNGRATDQATPGAACVRRALTIVPTDSNVVDGILGDAAPMTTMDASASSAIDTASVPDAEDEQSFECGNLMQCGLQCVDRNTDKNHCGQCGHRCDYPNALGVCVGGACKLSSCSPGFADCSDTPGCETMLGTSINCLSCGDACGSCSGRGCEGVGWTAQWGSPQMDLTAAVAVAQDGEILVAGTTGGSLLGANKGLTDAFLIRLRRDGSMRWLWQWGTTADERVVAAAIDRDGNVLVAGYTDGHLQGMSAGSRDAFVSKLNSEGRPLWTQQWGTSQYDDLSALAIDKSGNIFVGGYTEGGLDGTPLGEGDAFVTKLNPGGTIAWTKQWGTPQFDLVAALAVDADGNIYAGGTTDGSIADSNRGSEDVFVSKLQPDGKLSWSLQSGTISRDVARGLAVTRANDLVLTGNTSGNFAGTNAGGEDAFVLIVRQEGTFGFGHQWGTSGVDDAQEVLLDEGGNIFVVGATDGTFSGNQSQGGTDAFVTKLNSQGKEQWIQQWGTASTDHATALGLDKDNNLLVAGFTSGKLGAVDFGSIDAFLSKVGPPPL